MSALRKRNGRTRIWFFVGLAVKNLARHRRRTVITSVAIAAGVAVFIWMVAILQGFEAENDRNMSRYETGDAAVMGDGYWEERDTFPLDMPIDDPEPILEALDNEGIAAAPRVAFRGELIVRHDPFPEDGSLARTFYGIDVDRDSDVFALSEAIEEGRFLESGNEEVIIGRWLADQLGAEVGYPVSVTTRTRDGFYQIMDLEIVGIFDTSNPVINRSEAYLPIGVADEYLEMQGAVTGIFLSLPGGPPAETDPQPVRNLLSDIDGTEVLGFDRLNEDFAEIMELERAGTAIILFLLGIIAVVGISNTMLMAVLERENEIGMMRALGVRDGEIRWMFVFEAAGIGVLGAIIGLMLGALFVWHSVAVGIDYGVLMDGVEMDFRFDGVLYGVWHFASMISTAVFAAVIAGIVALVPTRAMLRRRITDSLRHS